MARVQLALNVDNIDEAIAFYSKLFATEPAKVRPGYANYAVENPPLKLVLIENPGQGGSLNHLGVEVETTDRVSETNARLTAHGMATATEDQVTCCYAVQDKVWVDDPNGAPWEIYTVLADAEGDVLETRTTDGTCGPGSCGATAEAPDAGRIPVGSTGDVCCAG